MIFMKPIHNYTGATKNLDLVVIPHKVNDFYETNSQPVCAPQEKTAGCDSSQS